MPSLFLELQVTADEMLAYYRGEARTVHATAVNGQTVSFPAGALQRHVTPNGVHGRFRLDFDEHHKFLSLERVEYPPGVDLRA